MNRRKYLKFVGVGSVTASVMWEACQPEAERNGVADNLPEVLEAGRQDFEIERDRRLLGETFFTEHELATIAILADIIIPRDDTSGSATEAGVPEFIEFIVKDIPSHQVPMRGGLRWLDMESSRRFEKAFRDCTEAQRMEIVADIAWPNRVNPGMEQGVAFFNRMRDLTATGFFTSEMGIADIGYQGNQPNEWAGVPEDVFRQYGFDSNDIIR
ncbi:MAG: hypothetical protein RLY31_314 [Bacteroidota bacterium]